MLVSTCIPKNPNRFQSKRIEGSNMFQSHSQSRIPGVFPFLGHTCILRVCIVTEDLLAI